MVRKYFWCVCGAFIHLLLVPAVSYAGAVITYHGRILDSNSRPVQSSAVTFKIRIYSPNPGKCLLYEETRTLNMSTSEGVFSIPIGDGVGARTSADPGILLEKIFSNDPNSSFLTADNPKIVCNSAAGYTPQLLDQRQLWVSFDDNSGVGEQILPIMDVNFVPFAVSSYDTQNVGGTPASSVLTVSGGGTATPISPTDFTELVNILNGTTTQYEKSGSAISVSRLPASVTRWQDGTGGAVYYNGGNVGIGTATPQAKLEVSGQIVSKVFNATSATTIDWSNGNVQYTSADCGAIEFSNMIEGGSYTLVVTGPNSGTCTFSQTLPDALAASAFKFLPANAPTEAGKETIYTFTRVGGKVYTSWLSGF